MSAYAPDINKPKEKRDNFYLSLQNLVNGMPKQEEIILLGDFNARIGNDVIPGVKNRFNEEAHNENGQTLVDFCTHNEFHIINTFFPHKEQQKYTFENTRGQKSIIDHVIINKNIHPSKILDVRVLTSANTGTDHNLVLTKMRCAMQISKGKKCEKIEKLNMESLEDPTTQYLYQLVF